MKKSSKFEITHVYTKHKHTQIWNFCCAKTKRHAAALVLHPISTNVLRAFSAFQADLCKKVLPRGKTFLT